MTQPQNPFAMDAPAAPAPPPAAPPQPAAAAPQNATQAAAQAFDGEDPFAGPAPRSERPRIRDIFGRLLLIFPYKTETVPDKNKPGETQERMTADVVVLDGGPLNFGGAPERTLSVPHTKVAQVPLKIDKMFISSAGLVSQSRIALANKLAGKSDKTMVLGRLSCGEAKNPGENPPYLLDHPTEQDKQIARQYLANVDPFA